MWKSNFAIKLETEEQNNEIKTTDTVEETELYNKGISSSFAR